LLNWFKQLEHHRHGLGENNQINKSMNKQKHLCMEEG
jgi:hypothetical protein